MIKGSEDIATCPSCSLTLKIIYDEVKKNRYIFNTIKYFFNNL